MFYQPLWCQSLRNAGCIHIVSAVFWYALHCRHCPVSLSTSEHLATIKVTNYRNETVIHMVSDFRCISASTFCCNGYTTYWSNILNYFWMLNKANDTGLRWINSLKYDSVLARHQQSIIKCCFQTDQSLINRNCKNPNIKNYYKAYCKLLSRSSIETKRSYYDKLISNSNNKIKHTWNIVKAIKGRKSDHDVTPVLSSHGKSTTNPKIISDSFNKYYLLVEDNIINNTFTNYNSTDRSKNPIEYLSHIYKTSFPTIKYSYASTKETGNIIKNLKTTNSYGYDEIPVKILKKCSYFIISPLTYIINRSLTTGIFPH
jgi:hypothetical protein